MPLKNFKPTALRLMAALLASYRDGPPRPELDRARRPHQRIALVKLDGIGDFILATGLLRGLREQWRGADATLFCRAEVGALARQQFPEWTVTEIPWPQNAAKKILLNRTLRRRLKSQPAFDLLLDLRTHRDFIERTVASWIPARQKIAPRNPHPPAGRWARLPDDERIYDHLVEMPARHFDGVPQDLQNHRALAEHLFPGLSGGAVTTPRLFVTAAEKESLVRRFAPSLNAPFLLVCPGARAAIREYPAAELARVVADAVAVSPLNVVVAGSRLDAGATGRFIEAAERLGVKTLNLTGALNLAEHLALMALARTVLCMETSHAHMAGALGVPAVVILGGGHHGQFAPWGESPTFRWLTHPLPCYGCNWICIHDRPVCIQDIPAAAVAKNLAEVVTLAKSARTDGDR